MSSKINPIDVNLIKDVFYYCNNLSKDETYRSSQDCSPSHLSLFFPCSVKQLYALMIGAPGEPGRSPGNSLFKK
jgi:hypothetical protein